MAILDIVAGVVGVLSAVSVLLHICKLDEKPWAKVFLSVSTDVIGAYKGYAANKAAKADAENK